MVATEEEVVEKVGDYEFTIRFAEEDSPEARERWARRHEVLAAWLLSQWQHQNAESN